MKISFQRRQDNILFVPSPTYIFHSLNRNFLILANCLRRPLAWERKVHWGWKKVSYDIEYWLDIATQEADCLGTSLSSNISLLCGPGSANQPVFGTLIFFNLIFTQNILLMLFKNLENSTYICTCMHVYKYGCDHSYIQFIEENKKLFRIQEKQTL